MQTLPGLVGEESVRSFLRGFVDLQKDIPKQFCNIRESHMRSVVKERSYLSQLLTCYPVRTSGKIIGESDYEEKHSAVWREQVVVPTH